MYKHWTASELKENLKLPENYKVDAFIVYGSYDDKQYNEMFISVLNGKKFTIESLKDDFLNKIISVKINKKRIWFCVEYGGARLSEFIHFACMLGSKRNILIGTCGGLKKGIGNFDIIIPTSSYSTDSNSHIYVRNNKDNLFNSSKKLSEEIINMLKRRNLNCLVGSTVTCQAMMGETWEDILDWSKKGFYGVEMESATLFAVSTHFNVPASAILQVADNLIEEETVVSESYLEKKTKLENIRKDLFDVALEISLS
jgi:purine-nucleoside phosphorylase